jgi:hypothetical protein
MSRLVCESCSRKIGRHLESLNGPQKYSDDQAVANLPLRASVPDQDMMDVGWGHAGEKKNQMEESV